MSHVYPFVVLLISFQMYACICIPLLEVLYASVFIRCL